jgi:hypothetical protein
MSRLPPFSLAVLTALGVTLMAWPGEAAQIPVRFAEGVTHGFLALRSLRGDALAQGSLLQVARGDRVESRLVFRFKDGSVYDETVVFSQQKVFTMLSYRLAQRGPAFPENLEASLDRASGRYTVTSRAGNKGREQVFSGTMELPADVYNGMILTVVKNLAKDASETVHVVAFTPKPRLIELELLPVGEQQVLVGDVAKTVTHYALKPRLGTVLKLLASLFGKLPPDYHCWVLTEDVPAFVRFEGPLSLKAPVWRIELISPRWPRWEPAPAVPASR